MKLRGAAVMITGASSGIGAATALRFAGEGARLALCARRFDRLQQVAERCRAVGATEVVLRKADVGRPGDARAFVNMALQHFERIDVLVNNAGRGWRGPLQQMPQEEVTDLVSSNLLGCIWTIQAALPTMLETRSGVIINVASVVGFRAAPYSAVYSASKHALAGLGHALRGELSGSGVKVCTVYPGTTDTEFFGDHKPDGPLVQSADSVAKSIVRNARRPRRDVIMLPYRAGHLAEPILGGLLDHAMGEMRRNHHPEYRA
ncbi:MAG: SDR family NAD(P)-dependent oxidoreductase [Candidatus Dormibacteraeota bacterium]|uniref:SDR family NAD(P)-dependent oxidoreductase n=1 Tax=Candidatus Dormibacter sp. TaxID=2973982 RepID=UPI000DB60AC1|nr:SDR family NAD(P)-dependent oxidoreductase [Candidatus Dormibacteraeota bacterium]PZR65961.1 MAG: short-chain dehydrogenase [Candidatus Dormibacteraeota bacterium]